MKQTIWFDLVTPKSVLFFEPFIRELENKNFPILVTSRGDQNYSEVNALLNLKKINFHTFGSYGGKKLNHKLNKALERQTALNKFIQNYNISMLINLCSVDGCRVAFGNGIKIINFCDLPTGKDGLLTHVARLTLPLSDKIFYPFYIPKHFFTKYCDKTIEYNFLDPIVYLQNQIKNKTYFGNLAIDKNKKTICLREEEYKSSYVKDNNMEFIYETLQNLDVNIIIIPRYEDTYIKEFLPHAIILKDKIELSHILPFCDLFIGAGGTINIEAIYWNIPTISTRSFLSYYDKYLLQHGLMVHCKNKKDLLNAIQTLFHTKKKLQLTRHADVHKIVELLIQ